MSFVLDASVTMAWCFDDEHDALAEHALDLLTRERAVVPPLWAYEVANVLSVAERHGRTTESQTAYFVQLLSQLPITVSRLSPALAVLTDIARRHRLSAYDAGYLHLAETSGLPLATLDGKLAAAATAAGVGLLGVE